MQHRETCRSQFVSISKKISERSTRKPLAVMLITEFKVYLTQPSRKKTPIARKLHTHSVSHALLSDTVSLRDVQTSRTRMAQGVCSAHVISPSHPLHSHVSSAVLAVPARSHRDNIPVCTVLNCSRCESAGQAHFRTSTVEFGYLADSTHSTEIVKNTGSTVRESPEP